MIVVVPKPFQQVEIICAFLFKSWLVRKASRDNGLNALREPTGTPRLCLGAKVFCIFLGEG
jgi:hypothetical protein